MSEPSGGDAIAWSILLFLTSGLFWQTIVLFGLAAFLTGQAIATTWRPAWQVVFYALLLGIADRFLRYALFGAELLSLGGYLLHAAYFVLVALFAYRVTLAHKMVHQYPWLYERSTLLTWRERPTH